MKIAWAGIFLGLAVLNAVLSGGRPFSAIAAIATAFAAGFFFRANETLFK